MRTRVSPTNPLGPTRYGYAYERIRESASTRHLDVGCYDGQFLADIGDLATGRRCGIDVNADAIAAGRARHPELELHEATDTTTLPFEDGSFDSISLLDVLEHLPLAQQHALLAEIRRVLRPGGWFIVTVPGQHVFSILDLGNLKFRFPRLHHRWYAWRHGEEEYRYRYVANPFGLVGDISDDKRWHEHFTAADLGTLLEGAALRVVDVDGSGLFLRPLRIVRLVAPGSARRLIDRIVAADARRFARTNLFVTAA